MKRKKKIHKLTKFVLTLAVNYNQRVFHLHFQLPVYTICSFPTRFRFSSTRLDSSTAPLHKPKGKPRNKRLLRFPDLSIISRIFLRYSQAFYFIFICSLEKFKLYKKIYKKLFYLLYKF